eukprot:3146141-Prymnesium_polylepis.1
MGVLYAHAPPPPRTQPHLNHAPPYRLNHAPPYRRPHHRPRHCPHRRTLTTSHPHHRALTT